MTGKFKICSLFLVLSFLLLPAAATAKSKESRGQAEKTEADSAEERARKAESDLKARMIAPAEITTVDELARWMTYYYMHPQPELLIPALVLADKENLMEGEHLPTLQAFISRIFIANPERIPEWYLKAAAMNEHNRVKILTAVWWTDTSQGKQLLEGIAKSLPEKPQAEFRKEIEGKPPKLETMAIVTPHVLDMLWAAYCATGDKKYVERIMSVLPWDQEKKELTKMVIASSATWSLKSNAQQHPEVLKLCRETMDSNAVLKPYLEKIVAEVAAPPSPEKTAREAGAREAASEPGKREPSTSAQ